jgi:hypothetical protein
MNTDKFFEFMKKNRKKLIGTIIIILLFIAILIYASSLCWKAYEPESIGAFILLVILILICLCLALWQKNSGRVLPDVGKYYAMSIPCVLSFIAIAIPLVSNFKISLTLNLALGLATMMSLSVSLAVLVQIRSAFTGEKELMKHAIEALELVRTRLIFITLTPNLGYAACVDKDDSRSIDAFHRAMNGAFNRLKHEIESDNHQEVYAFVATLSNNDTDHFYKIKGEGLSNVNLNEFLANETKGNDAYNYRSISLANELQKHIDEIVKIKSELVGRAYFPECLDKSNTAELKTLKNNNLPPLGFLLADFRMGVVFFHDTLLTKQPVPLRGYVTRDPEQIRALAELSKFYVR